jgi:hypothetical protein
MIAGAPAGHIAGNTLAKIDIERSIDITSTTYTFSSDSSFLSDFPVVYKVDGEIYLSSPVVVGDVIDHDVSAFGFYRYNVPEGLENSSGKLLMYRVTETVLVSIRMKNKAGRFEEPFFKSGFFGRGVNTFERGMPMRRFI